MAIQHETTSGRGTSLPNGKLVEYDQFIEDQLRKTRSQVRAVDIAGSFMTLVAGVLVFFLFAALVDHWVVSGGLGFWGRLTFFVLLMGATLAFLTRQVLPLVVRRINPLYAAETIERSRPTLKNSLLNFLFFRANPGGLPGVVYQALEEQAAAHLAKVRVESTVDRTKLVRTGYVLVGIVLIAAVYLLVSPKNLLLSAGRIMLPWADIGAPTRTAVVDVVPGDVQAFRGQQIIVSARIQNLPGDGKVVLKYTTSDGQAVERPLEMALAADGYKHACVLPPGEAGLQQSLNYRIEAGDAVTRPYGVQVVAAPTIVIRGLTYHYPAYTGLIDQRLEQQGDIRAIEGTEVTLEAVANEEIRSAHIDFDCDARHDQPMQFDRSEAKVTFRLGLKADKQPEHASYQLIFKNLAGQQNPQPVRHQIEVTRDLPPEVQIVAPKKDDLELPLDAAAQIEVVANDPDFALATLKLSASVGDKPMVDQTLLNEVHAGQLVRKFRFEPRKLALKVGDVVDYWAVAEDNKQPIPNRTETVKRRLRVVSPDANRSTQDQVARNNPRGDPERPATQRRKRDGDLLAQQLEKQDDQEGGERPPDRQQDQRDGNSLRDNSLRQDGGQQPGDGPKRDGPQNPNGRQEDDRGAQPRADSKGQSGGEQGRDESVPSDGSDDGDAIEEILKHQQGKQESGSEPRKGRGDKQQGQQKSGGQKQGDQQQHDQRQDDQRQDGRPDPGADRQDDQPQSADRGQQDGQKSNRGQSSSGDRRQPTDSNSEQTGSDQREGDKNQQRSRPQDGRQDNQTGKADSEPNTKHPPSDPGKQDRSAGQKGQKGEQSPAGEQGGDEAAGDRSQGSKGKAGNRDQKSTGSPRGNDQSGESAQSGDTDDRSQADRSSRQGDSNGIEGRESQHVPDGENDAANKSAKRQEGTRSFGQKQRGKADAANRDTSDDAQSDQARGKQDRESPDRSKQRLDERESQDQGQNVGDQKPTTGDGAQSKSGAAKSNDQRPSTDQQKPDAKGGDGERNKGNSGAGQVTKDNKGSPSPTTEARPTDKPSRTSKDDAEKKSEDQAHSAADDRRESDSEGQDSGDRSGGGKRGGGQTSNKSGTGGPGQNTAADEGAGKSDESGDGETADRAGDRASDGQKGKPSNQRGDSSRTRPSGAGDKPGGGEAQKDAVPPSDRSGLPTDQPGEGGTQSSGPPQGGKPGGAPTDQKWRPTEDQADEANLEYARKATDLAIAHLKDELKKGRPDPELLDRLGWTAKDLANFVKRWDQMRADARQPGEKGTAAQKALDDTLKSLGLRPKSTALRHNTARDDQSRGLKESRRTTPPAEYAEQAKAYSQGTARGEK